MSEEKKEEIILQKHTGGLTMIGWEDAESRKQTLFKFYHPTNTANKYKELLKNLTEEDELILTVRKKPNKTGIKVIILEKPEDVEKLYNTLEEIFGE